MQTTESVADPFRGDKRKTESAGRRSLLTEAVARVLRSRLNR